MIQTTPSARCAYDDCPNDERLSTLIIEAEDGQLERRVCGRHRWAVPIIVERLEGLAYRLAPVCW
jgi:hypothetical protein